MKAGGKAAEIHVILLETWKDAGEEEESLKRFSAQAAGKIWVAHHAAFDREMLQKALKRHYPGLRWENPVLDTAQLHRMLLRSTAENPVSLDDLCH
jgi:DNA polymerase-3 subunit epsilon